MAKRLRTSPRQSSKTQGGETLRLAPLFLSTLAALVLIVFCGRICLAQAPPTIEAGLKKYGIPFTQPGLQSALKDKRPEVRGLAASELASLKDTASTPLIVGALEGEKDG